ncbi:MAG: NUDIX domain-containing protein [Treponema sp.]|nr:NUDIX domain-containing protein [Treponema sp.]
MLKLKFKAYKGAEIALFQKQADDYAILLGKRTLNPSKGKWFIFGGKCEHSDKSLYETAEREFEEENGTAFSSVSVRFCGECKYKFNLPYFKWTTFLYEVDVSFYMPKHFSYKFSDVQFVPFHQGVGGCGSGTAFTETH